CVMYAGRIVEAGSVDEVLDRPLHPYSKGLIESVPSHNQRGLRLNQIPGMTPSLLSLPEGCAFRTRCPKADEACAGMPSVQKAEGGRHVFCHHPHREAA
ncbi:MAG: oligopeptide/dipeptide ABC transporter ATP-binding protein, partial [SAR324 cluster bacterium]|nr:oligopeptide/dipeptide ABC transporter ATP-binding protein [SAR324 cluster bacterium]